MDLRDICSDLRRKIDKTKPIITLIEKGELKVLSEAEERVVSMYPKWVAALEEAREGRVPVLYGGTPSTQPPSVPPPAHVSLPSTSASSPDRRVSAAAFVSDSASNDAPDPSDLKALFRSIAAEMRAIETPKARKAFLEQRVKALVSLKDLQAATKELDKVSDLRADIRSGTITNPSKGQLAKVQTFELLRQNVQYHKEHVREQQELIRSGVADALRELEESPSRDTHEGDEEGQHSPNASLPPQDEEFPSPGGAVDEPHISEREIITVESPECDATPLQDGNPSPLLEATEATPQTNVEASEEEEESEEEVEAGAGDDDDDMFGGFGDVFSVAKQKKHAKAEKSSIVTLEPTEAASPEVVVSPTADETQEIQPVEVVPEAPKEIDWSELHYKKFRPKLVFATNTASTAALAEASSSSKAPEAQAAPSSSAETRPPSQAPAKPDFVTLRLGGKNEAAPDAATSAPSKVSKPLPKGANKSTLPVQSPSVCGVLDMVRERVAKELLAVQEAQTNHRAFPTIAVSELPSLSRAAERCITWCVNVSPVSGPLCGVVVPLRLHFNEHYPFEAPEVTTSIEMPHPNIMSIAGTSQRVWRLCLDHAGPKEWDPAAGAASILQQLQTYFSAESFEKAKKNLNSFAAKVKHARQDCSRYVAEDTSGHRPDHPVPEIALWNGPFSAAHGSAAPTVDGRLKGPSSLTWLHCYAESGVHPLVLHAYRNGQRGVTVELRITETIGDDTNATTKIAFNTKLRSVTTVNGKDSPSPSGALESDAAPPSDASEVVFDMTVDLNRKRWSIASGGSVVAEVALPDSTTEVRLHLVLPEGGEAAIGFSLTDRVPVPLTVGPSCTPPTLHKDPMEDLEANEPPQCFLTQRSASEAVLGFHVEVLSRNAASIPTEVACSFGEYICPAAFEQVRQRRVLHDRRIDGMIPLLLGPAAAANPTTCDALQELKTQLTRLARNPHASTLYEPPFRTISAVIILPAAMNDAVRGIVRLLLSSGLSNHLKELRKIVTYYTQLLFAFAALGAQNVTAMQSACKSQFASDATLLSSGHVFAWSHFLEASWPEVVRAAFRADAPDFQRRVQPFIQQGSVKLGSALSRAKKLHFVVGALLSRLLRTTSIQRLLEDLASREGCPATEPLQELSNTLQKCSAPSQLTTLESLEELLGATLMERLED